VSVVVSVFGLVGTWIEYVAACRVLAESFWHSSERGTRNMNLKLALAFNPS
jgi:hypothetical protein